MSLKCNDKNSLGVQKTYQRQEPSQSRDPGRLSEPSAPVSAQGWPAPALPGPEPLSVPFIPSSDSLCQLLTGSALCGKITRVFHFLSTVNDSSPPFSHSCDTCAHLGRCSAPLPAAASCPLGRALPWRCLLSPPPSPTHLACCRRSPPCGDNPSCTGPA